MEINLQISIFQHYLSYLNNLRIQEYCGAVESLHHYFDRQQMSAPPNATGSGSKSKQEEEMLHRGFRYAALNMAALHNRFGHRYWLIYICQMYARNFTILPVHGEKLSFFSERIYSIYVYS